MGRGNARASSAQGGAARKKWFAQRIKDNTPGKANAGFYKEISSNRRIQQIQSAAEGVNGVRKPRVPSKREVDSTITNSSKMGRTAINRERQSFRAQAYREAERRGLSPAEAKKYTTQRVKELQDRQHRRETRTALRRIQANEQRSASRREAIDAENRRLYNASGPDEIRANQLGRAARRKRQDNLRRERIRQAARRRAAGQKSRALRSLRRVTPEQPYLRPARRRRQNLTDGQRRANDRARGRFIRERNRQKFDDGFEWLDI